MREVLEKKKKGQKPKPFEEKKVMVHHTVKRKYHAVASAAIKELCRQWR